MRDSENQILPVDPHSQQAKPSRRASALAGTSKRSIGPSVEKAWLFLSPLTGQTAFRFIQSSHAWRKPHRADGHLIFYARGCTFKLRDGCIFQIVGRVRNADCRVSSSTPTVGSASIVLPQRGAGIVTDWFAASQPGHSVIALRFGSARGQSGQLSHDQHIPAATLSHPKHHQLTRYQEPSCFE